MYMYCGFIQQPSLGPYCGLNTMLSFEVPEVRVTPPSMPTPLLGKEISLGQKEHRSKSCLP